MNADTLPEASGVALQPGQQILHLAALRQQPLRQRTRLGGHTLQGGRQGLQRHICLGLNPLAFVGKIAHRERLRAKSLIVCRRGERDVQLAGAPAQQLRRIQK